jgi:hypothetical protein
MDRQQNRADILEHELTKNQELVYAMNIPLTMHRNHEEIE